MRQDVFGKRRQGGPPSVGAPRASWMPNLWAEAGLLEGYVDDDISLDDWFEEGSAWNDGDDTDASTSTNSWLLPQVSAQTAEHQDYIEADPPRVEQTLHRYTLPEPAAGPTLMDLLIERIRGEDNHREIGQITKECGALLLYIYVLSVTGHLSGLGPLVLALMEGLGLAGPWGAVTAIFAEYLGRWLGTWAMWLFVIVAVVRGPARVVMGLGVLTRGVIDRIMSCLWRASAWTPAGVWRWHFYEEGGPREYWAPRRDWKRDVGEFWVGMLNSLVRQRHRLYGTHWGFAGMIIQGIIMLLMLPASTRAKPTGCNVPRGGLPVHSWIRDRYCRQRMNFAWNAGMNSGYGMDPRRGRYPRTPVRHGDVVGLYVVIVMGIECRIGYGYCERGNIITSSHVVGFDSLQVNGRIWRLNGRDPAKDIAIFSSDEPGGSRQVNLATLEEDDAVYVLGKRSTGFFSSEMVMYRTVVEVVHEGAAWMQTPITSQGDSGLPVFVSQNGSFSLAGVSGKWVSGRGDSHIEVVANRDTVGTTTSFVRAAGGQSPVLEKTLRSAGLYASATTHLGRTGSFKIVGDHCGSGKTRKYIAKAIRESTNRKVYALGPTRVVAREIYQSLKPLRNLGTLSLGTSDATDLENTRNARTTIMSHENFFNKFMEEKLDLRGALVIVDEFHVAQAATMSLLKVLLAATSKSSLEVLCLSATTPDMMYEKTNFHVQDVLVPTEDLRKEFYRKRKDEKGLVILPSIARAEKEVGDLAHIKLSRDNFHNLEPARDLKKGLIVATNIVECGANLGVDWVYDSGKEMTPVIEEESGNVAMVERDITQSSKVQRRGRVGRNKPGSYLCSSFGAPDAPRFLQPGAASVADTVVLLQGDLTLLTQRVYGDDDQVFQSEWVSNLAQRVRAVGKDVLIRRSDLAPYTAFRLVEAGWPPTRQGYYDWANTSRTPTNCHLCPKYADFQDERMHPTKLGPTTKPAGNNGGRGWFGRNSKLDDAASQWGPFTATEMLGKLRAGLDEAAEYAGGQRIANVVAGIVFVCIIITFLFEGLYRRVARAIAVFAPLAGVIFYYYLCWSGWFVDRLGVDDRGLGLTQATLVITAGAFTMLFFMNVTSNAYGHNSAFGYFVAGVTAAIGVLALAGDTIAGVAAGGYTKIYSEGYDRAEARGYVWLYMEAKSRETWASMITIYMPLACSAWGMLRYPKKLNDKLVETESRRDNPPTFSYGVSLQLGHIFSIIGILFLENWNELEGDRWLAAMVRIALAVVFGMGVAEVWMIERVNSFWQKAWTYKVPGAIGMLLPDSKDTEIDAVWKASGAGYMGFLFLSIVLDQGGINALTVWVIYWFFWLILYTAFQDSAMVEQTSHNTVAFSVVLLSEAHIVAAASLIAYSFLNAKDVMARRGYGQNSLLPPAETRTQHPMERAKELISRLDKTSYKEIASKDHVIVEKEENVVGKGYYKMDWLMKQGFAPQGKVLELGGGTGGFTQRMAQEEMVKTIDVLLHVRAEHNEFLFGTRNRRGDFCTSGFEKVQTFRDDIENVAKNGYGGTFNTLVCDIGESKSNVANQLEYSKKKRDAFSSIVYASRPSAVLYKELSPWDPDFLKFCQRHNLRALVSPFAKPTSTEIYAIRTPNGAGGDPEAVIASRSAHMLAMLSTREGPEVTVLRQQIMSLLEHEYKYQAPPPDRKFRLEDVDIEGILNEVARQRGGIKPPHNRYRSVVEIGVVEKVGDHRAGVYWNSVVEKVTRGLNNLLHFKEEWGLTDVSAAGTFRVFDEKVDTCPIEEHDYRDLEDDVHQVLKDHIYPRLTPNVRMLTVREAVDRLRNDAAVGMTGFQDWKDDPGLEDAVEAELYNIRNGTPAVAWVNTMGKREKKKRKVGKNRGSRLISYFPVIFRIIEQMIMGTLLDELCHRGNNPLAVGKMNPVDYFQLMAEEELEAGREVNTDFAAVADDIAGWDTRVGRMDLEREADFFAGAVSGQHAKDVKSLYRCYADHVTLLKRPHRGGQELSIIREKKGRLSGTIVTYVGNTYTNTVKTVTHVALSLGLSAKGAWGAFLTRRLNGYISGDDKVVAGQRGDIEKLAERVEYWEKTGYLRKDLEPEEPSKVITDFRLVDFCSHRPIFVRFQVDGNNKKVAGRWCATRPANEILAKAMYSVGSYLDLEAEAGHALQMRNFLVQYCFHRDIRRVIQSLTAALPVNMEPRGKINKPRYLATEWLNEKKLDAVVTKIFSTSTAYPLVADRHAITMSDVYYVSHREDMELGSSIHMPGRRTWLDSLPQVEKEVRKSLATNKEWVFREGDNRLQGFLREKRYDPYEVILISPEAVEGFTTVDPTIFEEDIHLDRPCLNFGGDHVPGLPTITITFMGWGRGYALRGASGPPRGRWGDAQPW